MDAYVYSLLLCRIQVVELPGARTGCVQLEWKLWGCELQHGSAWPASGPGAGGHLLARRGFWGCVRDGAGLLWGFSGPQAEIQVEILSQHMGALGLGTAGKPVFLEHLFWTQLSAGIFLLVFPCIFTQPCEGE